MKKLVYQSNDYCFAVYLDGALIAWGRHGDDPALQLQRVGERLGFTVEIGTLPDLDGGAPAESL